MERPTDMTLEWRPQVHVEVVTTAGTGFKSVSTSSAIGQADASVRDEERQRAWAVTRSGNDLARER